MGWKKLLKNFSFELTATTVVVFSTVATRYYTGEFGVETTAAAISASLLMFLYVEKGKYSWVDK